MKKIKVASQTENLTVETTIDNYLNSCEIRGLSPRTLENYRNSLDNLYAFLLANSIIYLKDLNIQVLENYIQHLQNSNLKDSSINFFIRNARSFIRWCEERELLPHIKLKEIKTDKPIKETYTQEELKILLRKPSKPKTFLQFQTWAVENFLYATGTRIGVLPNLRIEDIDFQGNTITLARTKNRKGMVVPMSNSLKKVLVEFLKVRKGEPTDFLFCNGYGGATSVRALQGQIYDYNLAHNITKTSAHLFRSSFAKAYILNGGDAFRLQKLLGHSQISTTQIYVNMFSTDLQKDYDKFNPLDNLNMRGEKIKIQSLMLSNSVSITLTSFSNL